MMSVHQFGYYHDEIEQRKAQGLRFLEEADSEGDLVVYVGVDSEHENWRHLNFIKKNKLSPPFYTVDEVIAWARGFQAASFYHRYRERWEATMTPRELSQRVERGERWEIDEGKEAPNA